MHRRLPALARAGLRAFALALQLGVAIALALLLGGRDNPSAARWLSWWSRGLCRLLHVRLERCGEPLSVGCLMVANHVSWLDVFCIAALRPTRFLAKREVARWPLIGWLCGRFGTLFIDRGGREGASEATRTIAAALARGETVLVFPEGTSTRGAAVGRFHPRLFEAGLLAQRPIQAVTVAYGGSRDGAPDPTSPPDAAARVPFVGDAALVPHLFGLLELPRIQAAVAFEAPLSMEIEGRDGLARAAQAQVALRLARRLAIEQRAHASGRQDGAVLSSPQALHERVDLPRRIPGQRLQVAPAHPGR